VGGHAQMQQAGNPGADPLAPVVPHVQPYCSLRGRP
jgi:hypothetical protein